MLTPYFEHLDFSSFASMMYAIIGLITLALIILLLLGYNTNPRMNQSFTWPIFILKFLFILFTTILYLPILDLFFQIINCDYNDQEVLVNIIFDEKCWVGPHIIHGTIAIVGIAIFQMLTITFNLLYYEARYNTKCILSQQSGRPKALTQFYFFIIQVCFTVVDEKHYDYVIIYFIFIGAFICFWKLHSEQPYNHVLIQKIMSVFATLMLWSATLLCFTYYLEDTIFHGTVYAWLVGLPLMAFAVFKKEKYHYDLLLININKTDDSGLIISLTNYIQKLLSRYQIDQHYNIMLNALLEVHKTICPKDDCVLKSKKSNNQRLINNRDENLSFRDQQIHMLLGEVYTGFIRAHQTQVKLKINYAFYLLDLSKLKPQALNEFTSIEMLSPSLDNEFTIFRYKRIIEDEMNSTQNEGLGGNLDFASELTFQNFMRSFQNKIERATLMHMDFWSQLQEDNPDLGKMNDIGAKINAAIVSVEELWNKMQKMTQNLPKAMRLYGKFIIEVLQDKDYGEDLLERAKVLQTQNNKMKNKQQISVFSSEDLGFEPLPTILVSTSSEKFVQITNMNLSVSNLFGYHKTELLNRKINLLMPPIYSKFHDAYVEKFIQNNDQQKLTTERLVYLKLKSGYIMPSYLYLKIIQSVDENLQIVAQFRTQRTFKTACYLLLDSDEVIEQISSSCICNLFIDYKMISQKKIFFTELFPTYSRSDYLNKTGGVISLNLSTPLIQNSNYLQYYIGDLEDQTQVLFQLQITEVDNEHSDQVVGYIIKLEKLTNDQSQIITPELLQQLSVPNQVVNNFQFRYFAGKALYVGENSEELNSARVDQTVIWDQSSRISEETQAGPKPTKTEEVLIQKTNYAEGIRTLKLFENRVQDLEDIRMSFSEGDEVQHQSIFQPSKDSQEEVDLGVHNNVFRNRKSLNLAINNYRQPTVMIYLSCAVNFLILAVVALSFTAYFLSTVQFQDAKTNLDLIQYASLRNAECGQIVMNVQNLEMLKIGIWNLSESEAQAYEQVQRTELNDSIYSLTSVNTKLMLNDLYVNEQLSELHSSSVINVRINENSFSKYDIIQATQQIISKALLIRDKKLVEMTNDDEDVKFLTYNLFNDIVMQYRNETNLYFDGLGSRLVKNIESFLIILIVAGCMFFFLLLMIIVFLIQLNSMQEQILQLFIDIPEKTVKYLYNKSENFISNLQVGEEEEISSDLSEGEQEEQQELSRTLKSKRRRKMFKNTNSFQRTQIIIAMLIVCLFIGYFLLDYFLNKTISDNISQQLMELNVTSRCESYYRYVDNAERQLFLNRSDPILLNDAYTQVVENIQQNYQVDASLHQEHALNSGIINSGYYDTFQQLFMYDSCSILTAQGYSTLDYCETFAEGSIQQGMAVAVAKYFESLRYLMTIYDLFYGHPEADFSTVARRWGKFRNITQDSDNVTNYIYNLNNFDQAVVARELQNSFIKGAFRYLLQQYIAALLEDISVTQTQLLAFFIVFDVLIFLCYFILWIPSSLRMTRDIWRTKGLIMMIPLRVIQKIKSIKEFVNNLVHGQDNQK